MGNLPQFSIGYTQSRSLNNLHKKDCDFSITNTKKLIEKKIKKISSVNNPSNSKDYQKYGLYPGQQIRRTISKIIPHTAIYIYDGLIFEMGSGPKKCSKNLGNPFTIGEHLCGLSTVKSFKTYADRHGVDVYKIVTKKDSDPEEINRRMNRVLEVVGKYKYSFFTDNCLHMANYVSHGRKTLLHLDNKKVIHQSRSRSQSRSRRRRRRSKL